MRSGETVAAAVAAALELKLDALLFNCSHPEAMTAALKTARATIDAAGSTMRLGVYAKRLRRRTARKKKPCPPTTASTKSAPTSPPPPTWIGRNAGARRARTSLAAAVALSGTHRRTCRLACTKTPDKKTHDAIPPHRTKKTQPEAAFF